MRELSLTEMESVSGGWFDGGGDEPEKPTKPSKPKPKPETEVPDDEVRDPFFEWGDFTVRCCGPVDVAEFELGRWLTTPQPLPENYDYRDDPMYYENNGGSGIAAPY